MTALTESLAQVVGMKAGCVALNLPRSRVYRARLPLSSSKPHPSPARALSDAERSRCVRRSIASASLTVPGVRSMRRS
jgi:hypothetical protein